MVAHSRSPLWAVAAGLLAACEPNGTNGPTWAAPRAAEGPCWEVDLADGLTDRDAWPGLFACFNRFGAFEPLEPLVLHVTTSTTFDGAVDAAAETFPRFDLLDALEIVLRWQGSPDDPSAPVLALYAEAYDRGLFPPALALLREASDHIVACEGAARPEVCSLPRLVRRARSEGTFDDARAVFDAIHADAPADVRARHETILASWLLATSTQGLDAASAPPRFDNELMALLGHLLRPRPGGSAFAQLLPHLQFFLAPGPGDDARGDAPGDAREDGFAEALVENLAPLWKSGAWSRLPEMLEVIYTTTSTGAVVGFAGRSIADELLAGAERLTGLESLLRQEFTLDEGEAPVTILELALDTVDGLYESGAGIPAVLDELESLRGILCTGARPRALCRLMTDVLPAARAAVRTGIGEIALPVLHVVHRHVDMDRLFDLVERILDLDLLEKTKPLVRRALELQALDAALDLFPTLVDVELGRLRAPGRAILRWARWACAPGAEGPATPLEITIPMLERLLDPRNPAADLDRVAGKVGAMLLEPSSAGSWAALSQLDDRWTRASDALDLDLTDELGRALDDPRFVDAAARLGADARFISLATPVPGRARVGAADYLRDLIRDDLVSRVLAFSAELLGFMTRDDDRDGGDAGREPTEEPADRPGAPPGPEEGA